jgi:heterodisulfide reductase subunit A
MAGDDDTMVGAVLVVGGGISGIRAALDLAESGFKVYLSDSSSGLGGTLAQLDYQFPTNHCGMCKMLPVFFRDDSSQYCLRRDLHHRDVAVFPYTDVESVSGEAGAFDVSLRRKSTWIDEEKCIRCGRCIEVCPVEVDDEFNVGLGRRKAVYQKAPLGLLAAYTIDRGNCTQCGKCDEVCPTQAVELSAEDRREHVAVGSIILATGFEEFDPVRLTQYGYGRFPNVVTSIEFERLFSQTGPTQGRISRPSDSRFPKRVGFVQCVGSRDRERPYCSSACCMYAMKEAMILKDLDPGCEVHIFCMDVRAFGKDFYRYYLRARDEAHVQFIRTRVPVIKEDPQSRNLMISYLEDGGAVAKGEYDLVVLSVGQAPPKGVKDLARVFGIELDEWGFCRTEEFSQVRTTREGVFVAGSFSGLKDISETLIQASAAALEASELISSRRHQLTARRVGDEERDVLEEDPKIAAFLCLCGEEISSAIDVDVITRELEQESSVVLTQTVGYLCHGGDLERVTKEIVQSGANRVLFAACLSYGLERKLTAAAKEVGLNPALVEHVDLRETAAWAHGKERATSTGEARRLVWEALERLKSQEPLQMSSSPILKRALVLGGGLAGLTAARAIARHGFEVVVAEKTGELGGMARRVFTTLSGKDPQAFLQSVIAEVCDHPLIEILRGTTLKETTGYVGNFASRLETPEGEIVTVEHGVTIVATGAEEYEPREYLYGKNRRVTTQLQFEEALAHKERQTLAARNIVMIQCVGCRDDDRPYCSRVCCSEAIKNALALKKENPVCNIFILHRDVMTYGFKEEYYTEARNAGILFIRYDVDDKPQVRAVEEEETETLWVTIRDPILDERLTIETDMLVLSAATVAPEENRETSRLLDVSLNEDGFFEEADIKWRPVDFLLDGIYVCGLAHSPGFMDETVTQAEAAAQRALAILARDEISSGRIVSEVNERRCSLCEVCIDSCPYGARIKDEENRRIVVREPICQGCGVCAMVCPNKASKLRGFKEKQMLSLIDAALL